MDHLRRSLRNTFATQVLDRAAHLRPDAGWVGQQPEHPDAKAVVFQGHDSVWYQQQPLILSAAQLTVLRGVSPGINVSLLGTDQNNHPWLLLATDDASLALTPLNLQSDELELRDLRGVARELHSDIAGILSYAKLLNHWHSTSRFCGCCGSPFTHQKGGYEQLCSNEGCGHIEFPRLNPAVIMRVTHQDKILLGRQESWPENRYSVLAGFVEIGETLETAVKREVMEEVGITVENINYHSSQPWPFPNSLMLGYTAEAVDTQLQTEQDDIETAMWLTAAEFTQGLRNGSVLAPPDLSISYRLIDDWFTEQTGDSLDAYTGA